MNCEDCPRFDHDSRKCKDGKVNPRRWDQAVEVANIMGLRMICTFNDHRERLIKNRGIKGMAQPKRPD